MSNPEYTWQEIQSQPAAWSSALEVLERQAQAINLFYQGGQYENILFTGCGSTYYLALAAAALFQDLAGKTARGLPASELWLYPRSAYSSEGRTLLVAISRSGETTETRRACENFVDQQRGDLLTLSCCEDCALTALGQLNLVFPSGAEMSIAQTRAFSTLYLATVALAALSAERPDIFSALQRLPEAGQKLLDNYSALAKDLGQEMRLDRFYFLGSGPRYGLAAELSLKMKEMSLSHSEPFHFMEFRHGPKSMVTGNTLIFGLVSEENYVHEMAVVEELRRMGARVLTLGEMGVDISFASQVVEAGRNLLYLPVGQMLAYERSLANGLKSRPAYQPGCRRQVMKYSHYLQMRF